MNVRRMAGPPALLPLALALFVTAGAAQDAAPLSLSGQTHAQAPDSAAMNEDRQAAETPPEPAESPAEAPDEAASEAPAEAPAASEPPPDAATAPSPAASAVPAGKPDPGPLPSDVAEKHWAAGAVRTVLKGGLMDMPGNKFNGAATASRRDLALVIGALLTRAGKTGTPAKLPDVAPTDPAAKQIAVAAGSGALRVKKGGKLSGNAGITREDIAIGFSRLLAIVKGEKETAGNPPIELNDLPPDSPLYVPAQRVLKAKIISLMNLKYEGYLPVTRFQLAAVAVKALEATKAK